MILFPRNTETKAAAEKNTQREISKNSDLLIFSLRSFTIPKNRKKERTKYFNPNPPPISSSKLRSSNQIKSLDALEVNIL